MPAFLPERRAFLLGALASGAIALASGTLKAKLPAPESEPDELTIAVGLKAVRLFELLGELYTARSSMKIKVVSAGASATSQFAYMRQHGALNAGQKGAVDIFGADVVHMAALAEQNCIRLIQDDDLIDFLPAPTETCRISPSDKRAGYYGLPFSSNVGMLFARSGAGHAKPAFTLPDLIRGGAGPGPTWTAQLSTEDSDHGEGLLCNFFEHVVAVDGCESLISPAGRPSRDVKMWNVALSAIRSARRGKRLNPCKDDTGALALFNAGKVDFMRNWPTFLHRSIGDERVMPADLTPTGTGVLGGINLAITARTKRDRDAREFVKFLTGVEAQKIVALYGLPPTLTEIYDNTDLIPLVPHLEVLKQSIQGANHRPHTSQYEGFSDFMAGVVRRCLGADDEEITEQDIKGWEKFL